MNEETRNEYGILEGKSEGKRSLGRPRRRLMVNIKMDYRETGCGRMDFTNLAQDSGRWGGALVNTVMNL
jgi:hypothetical protein